jgi:hypothetical protein
MWFASKLTSRTFHLTCGANFLNISNVDIVCLHGFDIFDGPARSHILALFRELRMPVVTTLNTVLLEPSADQKLVMEL